MKPLKKQVHWADRLVVGLLFCCLAACASAPQVTPTSAPTATQQPAPTETQAPTPTPAIAPRSDVEYYVVVEGDTLSSIAAAYGLQPQTVLWANRDQLLDNPDFLLPGMQLLILPVDGVYHQVGGTDTITGIASFFVADAQAIMDEPLNQIDPSNPVIFAGQWLLVPGGTRALNRGILPSLPRAAMAVDISQYGSGACPTNQAGGAVGDGTYAWPVQSRVVAGEAFWAAHTGVDLAVDLGEAVLAADDGVVVFSGWSHFDGYAVMLDHGNGEYSLYAGLGQATAVCGASVNQGDAIAVAGMTGHPAGPFLHFEIRHGADFVDPLTLLP
jgi:murein DD-endopeptidase MepM/ murein hydrolase activator NlpD